jgi:integrase
VVTVLLGMLTGLRGTSLAALTVGDLQVSSSRVLLRAQVLKRRLQPRSFADWVIPLHLGDVRGPNGGDFWRRVFSLLYEHCLARRTWAADRPLLAPLGSSRRQLSEAFVDEQVSVFVQRYGGGVSLAGFSSHSLRIGAVSAMLAAGVSRDTIRVWLKWKSAGMIDLYARVVQCDSTVFSLYQWMAAAGVAFTLYV